MTAILVVVFVLIVLGLGMDNHHDDYDGFG